jgi:hypothetical protein
MGVVRQGFHESSSFLGDTVVVARLRSEYSGFEQSCLTNSMDPAVLLDLMMVDGQDFGTVR